MIGLFEIISGTEECLSYANFIAALIATVIPIIVSGLAVFVGVHLALIRRYGKRMLMLVLDISKKKLEKLSKLTAFYKV